VQGVIVAAAVVDEDDEAGEIDVVLETVAVRGFKAGALVFDGGDDPLMRFGGAAEGRTRLPGLCQ
jgi:hypothetical protein